MFHNGHTYRTICKEVRISPSTLSNIIKSESGHIEDSKTQLTGKSKETRALALYNEEKEPLGVAIELNITTEEAINFYQKFQQITSLPLENIRLNLQNELETIESAKNNANSHLTFLRNQVTEQAKTLEYYKSQCEYWRNQLIVIQSQRKQLWGW
jgi:hypothetical protein